MNATELLALDRELTNEELEFLEQEALKGARELQRLTEEMISPKMEQDAPELAQRLRASVARMVSSLEHAATIPFE